MQNSLPNSRPIVTAPTVACFESRLEKFLVYLVHLHNFPIFFAAWLCYIFIIFFRASLKWSWDNNLYVRLKIVLADDLRDTSMTPRGTWWAGWSTAWSLTVHGSEWKCRSASCRSTGDSGSRRRPPGSRECLGDCRSGCRRRYSDRLACDRTSPTEWRSRPTDSDSEDWTSPADSTRASSLTRHQTAPHYRTCKKTFNFKWWSHFKDKSFYMPVDSCSCQILPV